MVAQPLVLCEVTVESGRAVLVLVLVIMFAVGDSMYGEFGDRVGSS